MQKIFIKDITKSHRAISAQDGEKVFDLIVSYFEQKEKVTVDFTEIDLTITAFLNSSIGKLYSKYKPEVVKELLRVEHMSAEELPLLKLVVDKAKERFRKPYSTDLDQIDLLNED